MIGEESELLSSKPLGRIMIYISICKILLGEALSANFEAKCKGDN